MALSSQKTADQLISIYSSTKKRFQISHDEFKNVAGKTRLRSAYLNEVDSYMREDGFMVLDLREESDCLAIVKISTITAFDKVPDIDEFFHAEEEDWDGDE